MLKINHILLTLGLIFGVPLIIVCQANTFATDTANSEEMLQVKGIFIIGNEKTHTSIIRRELTLQEGQSVKRGEIEDILKKDKQKIFNLALFQTVEIKKLETRNKQIDLFIKVEERWYLFPSPFVRPVDRNLADWVFNRGFDLTRVNYGLNLLHFNVRGRNEKLKLNAQFGFSRKFSLQYIIPYINRNQKQGIAFSINYSQLKTIKYNTIDHVPQEIRSDKVLGEIFSPSITYTIRNAFFNTHAITADYNKTTLADTVNVLNEEYIRGVTNKQEYFRLTYSFVRDLRDYRSYPLDGFYLGFRLDRLGIGIFENTPNQWRGVVEFSNYEDFGDGWYIASSITSLVSSVNNQNYVNYNRLGFYRQLIRGLERDVIETPIFVLQKNDLKKQLIKGSFDVSNISPVKQFSKVPYAFYAKVFFDHGWSKSYPNFDGSDRLADKYLYSAGVGVDFVGAYDLVLRLEYSYNSTNQQHIYFNIKAGI